ncbi:MAG: serine hydrolase [Acidobacteria bacterium]|nr:serine hydrolase [Acidobacteriota bacterium]
MTTPPVAPQQKTKPAPKGKPTTRAAEQAATTSKLEGFDTFVAQAMKDWKVPGLSLVIVQDGKVILSRGYGFRDVKNQLPVTPQTLFAIGSITKSFTAASLARLVDEGKLEWDKPVREYMPSFRMYDEVASEHMTPRDLVTHRSGLPRHDALWYNSELTRAQLVERLRYLEPSKDFRSTYQYNNLMFVTAGYLASHVSGVKWEDLVQQRIFAPLGMQSSNFAVSDSQKSSDFAHPYKVAKEGSTEEVKEVPFRVIDALGPAGSINSNAEGMAQYLLMYLGRGKHGETRVLSESNVAQMTTPQMVAPSALRYPEIGHVSYGMALSISSYRGHKMVSHGGAIDGFTALLSFLPQDNLGVVVLTNLESNRNSLPSILAYNTYDRLLGLDQVPWNQRLLDDLHKNDASEAEAKQKGFTIQKKGTHPAHDLQEYVGEYENPGYGSVGIGREKDELTLTYNRLSSLLKHFHYDIFETPPDPLNPIERTKVSFFTNDAGDIGSLTIPMEPAVKPVVFTRRPDRRMTERAFLEILVGQYEVGPNVAAVSLRGEKTLILTLASREYELVPRRGTLFELKGVSGYSIEFNQDTSGMVTGAVFYQPKGTFVAKKKP